MNSIINRFKRWLTLAVRHTSIVETEGKLPGDVYLSGAEISGDVRMGEGCRVYRANVSGNVTMGRFVTIWGPNCYIGAHIHGITIGSFSSIARNVSVQEANHRFECLSTYHVQRNVFNKPLEQDLVSKGPIVIGNDVWIGANAVVLSGVQIGDGAIVGAGAVVTKNIPPYAIVGGNPARVLRYRFEPPMVEALLQLGWWNWPLEQIKLHPQLFGADLHHSSPEQLIALCKPAPADKSVVC